jgi:hypothetical protein
MNEKRLAEYVAIENQYKALEEKRESLRKEIVADMIKSKTETIEKSFGTFTVARKTSYEYSKKVEKAIDNLKIMKHEEELKGIAKPKETEFLRFTQPKTTE